MARSEERRPGVRRAIRAVAVVACAGLASIPVASPFLYHGVEESRRELDALLGRAGGVRRNEAARVGRVRALLDQRLREARWAREDALGALEETADRLLARQPSTRAIEARPAPPVADDVVGARVEDLARTVGLTADQQERLGRVCAEYRVRAEAALQEERVFPSGRGPERLRELQDEALRRIESLLLPEQRIAYERLDGRLELLRKAGVIVPTQPGARVARSEHR